MTGQQSFNFQLAIDELKDTLHADFIGLALVDLKKHHYELKWRYVAGNISLRYRRIVLQSGKGVAGIVFKTGKPMVNENVENCVNAGDLYNYPIIVFEKLKSFGAIPLFQDDHVQGVIMIGYREVDRLTPAIFEQFKQTVGPQFGSFHLKERLKDDVIEQ
ncbi:GAF domain-containing protein [Sporosarcina sp. P37]|uniref:GAF domain-containing protein n=1 Tax=unclassified Sporosarcina TaxID=2647733 RepID=UPI0009BEF364|nr:MULTISPECIES: GAF domain-containing protein [unclassified Sporosarcina]ARD48681.1 control of nitrate reduction [Sporosarcina sp. P33]ARK25187.1 GAF domain-containing protein [Sporosarcina sp. P37]PID17496.1 GAF domain-containing protein [Sporosarcina sp. P35]